jgi:putative transposase
VSALDAIRNLTPYDPDIHHRRSIRVPGYDYAQPGAYFVTICLQDRECLLGEIVGDQTIPNEAGRVIETWWHKLPQKFSSCNADTFVVMPNHIHGIIMIRDETVGADPRVRPDSSPTVAADPRVRPHSSPTVGVDPRVRPVPHAPLPSIVQWFKTMTTNAYIRGVQVQGWTPFAVRLWQRNYYEHIVRDEVELERIRDYIVNNPVHWRDDPDNPQVSLLGPTRGSAPTTRTRP